MKSSNAICSILIFATVLSFVTPLYAFQGYVLVLSMLFALALGYRAIDNKRFCLIMGIAGLYIIYILNTPSVFINREYLNNSLLMFIMICVFLIIVSDKVASEISAGVKITALDISYLTFYIVCLYELAKYTIKNISVWNMRNYNPTFFAGYQHVDFSVIVMIVFMIGMKRGFYALSLFLAASAWIILPARTMQLFFLLFAFCWLLREKMYTICVNCRLINKSFKWMLIFLFGSIAFSIFWLTVLGLYFRIVAGHEGLYDTSNFERFQSILYATEVIVKQKLIFRGLDSTVMYGVRLTGYIWRNFNFLGPHNSYLSLVLVYSLAFGGSYMFGISKIIDQIFSPKMIPYIVPYLVCGCILHDMLIGPRAVMFLTALLVPYRVKKNKMSIKICNIKFKLC